MKHWWCHPMMYSWHHWPSYDIMDFPYKRCCAGLIGDSQLELDLLHLGLRVHFGSAFNWLLRVLVHARIDMPTRPCHQSLLPSSILIRVVITAGTWYALMPLSTPTHPVSVTLATLHASFTGLSPFQLVLVCTIYRVVVYISGSVHNFLCPWVGPNWLRMARTVEGIPPWLKPKSASVLTDKRKRVTRSRIRRVSKLDWENTFLVRHGHAEIALTHLC